MSVVQGKFGQPSRADTQESPLLYPTTETGWKDRYWWLHAAYLNDPYTTEDQTAWRLFRAFDGAGKLTAETARLTRDYQFVVNHDAASLFGGSAVLEVEDEDSARLEAGEAIWKRSALGSRLGVQALTLASLGRVGLEVMRTQKGADSRPIIVAIDPRNYVVTYDKYGLEIESVVITIREFDSRHVDEAGNVQDDAAMDVYRRELTKDEVITTLNGEIVDEESGKHRLGVVPFSNVIWQEYTNPEHGLHAAHGMERGLAMIDSLMTQIQAVGNRYGDPTLVVTGAKLSASNDAQQFGRQLSGLKEGAKVEYLESKLAQIGVLKDALVAFNTMIRNTFPEFGVFGGGANASGEALKYRAGAFIAKIEAARRRIYPQYARAVAIADAVTRGAVFDPDAVPFRVGAGPVLPVDIDGELARVHDVKLQGGFGAGDYTRHLQRLGMVGQEHDALKYETAARDASAMRAVEFMTGGSPGTRAGEE